MNKKIAIVYDWIDKWGGVERVLLNLAKLYPQAVFYTSYYNPKTAPWAKKLTIVPSFMQRLPGFVKKSRILSIPFYPFAFESFDFKDFDVVISVTSSFAKSVLTRPETLHICYLLTPTRFLWQENKSTNRLGLFKRILTPYINYLKKWDKIASHRPDKYLCISQAVKKRLKKYYGLEGLLVYPPFDIDYWEKIGQDAHNIKFDTQGKEYYLVVSRLEPYKNIDCVIDAFNRLPNRQLIIIGTGSQEAHLKKKAGRNCFFVKNITDSQLGGYYQGAKALIMMQEEDFGYTALESQFFGTPVIAYNKGGASETVLPGKTGLLLQDNSPRALLLGIEKFESIAYTLRNSTKKNMHHHLLQFSPSQFASKFHEVVVQLS